MNKLIRKIKENIKVYSKSLREKTLAKKADIIKVTAGVFVVLLVSFLMEYFAFGYLLNMKNGSSKNITIIENENIEGSGFLMDEKGSLTAEQESSELVIPNGGGYVNDLEIKLSNNTDNYLTMSYLDSNGKEITQENRLQKNILKNKYDFMPFLVFHLNAYPQSMKLSFQNPGVTISQIKIDNVYHFNFFRFFYIFCAGILVFLMVFFRKLIVVESAYGFLIISLVAGTLLAFTQSRSFISWDDHIHYKNADNLTFKNVINKDVEDIYARTNSVPYSYSIKEQEQIDNFFDNQLKTAVPKKSKKSSFSLKEFYNEVGYLPSAAALVAGRIMHLPYHVIFMLGRWANVILYSLVVFFAIRKLRNGKMIMSVIALFPTSLFLASNYSYDFWVTSFTMLAFAYLFYEMGSEEKIDKKNIAIMLGAFIVGLGPKAIYFLFLLLPLLLKKKKFKSKEDYKKFLWLSIGSILLVLVSFLLPFLISGEGGGDMRGGSGVNSGEQVKFILSQPLEYAKILFDFMLGYLHPANAVGYTTSFAYLGAFAGSAFLFILLIFTAITDREYTESEVSHWKTKSLMLAIFFITAVLVSTALYVAFTPVGYHTINGVQPRYLVPLIFPFMYIIFSSRIKNPFNRKFYVFFILGAMSLVIFKGVWQLVVRNYF